MLICRAAASNARSAFSGGIGLCMRKSHSSAETRSFVTAYAEGQFTAAALAAEIAGACGRLEELECEMAYAIDHRRLGSPTDARLFAPHGWLAGVAGFVKRVLDAGLRWGRRRELPRTAAFDFACPGDRVKLTDAMER